MEQTTTKKTTKTKPPVQEEMIELTPEEKLLKKFSETYEEMLFTFDVYEGTNKALALMFNAVSKNFNDMDAAIMEIAGALEVSRSSILKTKENNGKTPEPKGK